MRNRARPIAAAAAVAFLAGCAGAPLAPDVERRVRAAVERERARFPELAGDAIALSALDGGDAVFFQANFTRIVDGRAAGWHIQANERAFASGLDDALDERALAGVIGHELAHLADYTRRKTRLSLLELLPLAAIPESNHLERATDVATVDRGLGLELLRYRVWLYRAIRQAYADDAAGAGAAIAQKRAVYYAPHELALLVDVKARCPAVFAAFLADPPRDAREIAGRCP